MNDTMKAITVGVIVLALYLALKHGKPTTNGPGTSTQMLPQGVIEQTPCGTALPMETTNCAIPIAADYLGVPIAFNPATAPIGTRSAFAQPLDMQTNSAVMLGPVNTPYGVFGGTVTPNTRPLAPCALTPECCVMVGSQSCAAKV